MKPLIQLLLSFLLLFTTLNLSAQGLGLDAFVNAELLKEQGKYKEAIDAYTKALEKEPNNLKYTTQKCQCYMDAREIKMAITCFEDLAKVHKDNIETFETLANLYTLAKKNKDAIKAYESALNITKDPEMKFVYQLQIIHIFYQANKIADAGKYLEDARKAIGDHFDILFLQASFFNATNQPTKALENMKKVMSELGTAPETEEFAKYYFEMGLAQYKINNYTDALANFAKANYDPYKAQIKPLMPESICKSGEAYYSTLFYEKAKKCGNDALRIQPDYESAKKLNEKIEKAQEIKPEMLEKMNKSINAEQNPNEKLKLLENAAMTNFNMGSYETCIKYCDEVFKMQPKNFNLIYLQSVAKFLSGEVEPATHMLEVMSKIPNIPNDLKPKCFFTLGIIYKSKNDMKQSYMSFKKATFGAYADAANAELREIKQGTPVAEEEENSEGN